MLWNFFLVVQIKGLYLHSELTIVLLTKSLNQMAYIITEDCTACGSCIDECPVDAISEGDIYKIDPDVCTDCGSCADVCPVEAIHPA
jgi:NAD-dependent dihydropyrimidine dehydrogenase PreA subunit